MSEKINRDSIIEYLNRQQPKTYMEVAKTAGECEDIMKAIIELVNRLNTGRQVELLVKEKEELTVKVCALTHDVDQLVMENENVQQLVKQRNTLQAERQTIVDLESQKAEVEQLQAFVAKHNIPQLQQEVQLLQQNLGSDITSINEWLNEANACFNNLQIAFASETKELLLFVQQKRSRINNELTAVGNSIKEEHLQLSGILQTYDAALTQTYTSYTEVADQLNDISNKLQEIKEKHDKNIAGYELHLEQDKHIYGELGKRHNIDNYLKQLQEEVETKLQALDAAIKAMIAKADHLVIF